MTTPTIDEAKLGAFMEQVLGDAAGLMASTLATLDDRLGLKVLPDRRRLLMLEMNSADDPNENVGPLATILYGISVVYCMTTSLAHGGAGLGTCGLPAARVQELCKEAGFANLQRLELQDPFNSLYLVQP